MYISWKRRAENNAIEMMILRYYVIADARRADSPSVASGAKSASSSREYSVARLKIAVGEYIFGSQLPEIRAVNYILPGRESGSLPSRDRAAISLVPGGYPHRAHGEETENPRNLEKSLGCIAAYSLRARGFRRGNACAPAISYRFSHLRIWQCSRLLLLHEKLPLVVDFTRSGN